MTGCLRVIWRGSCRSRSRSSSILICSSPATPGALKGLFLKALGLCAKAGMVRLGRFALDGSKVRANASCRESRLIKIRKAKVDLQAEARTQSTNGQTLPVSPPWMATRHVASPTITRNIGRVELC